MITLKWTRWMISYLYLYSRDKGTATGWYSHKVNNSLGYCMFSSMTFISDWLTFVVSLPLSFLIEYIAWHYFSFWIKKRINPKLPSFPILMIDQKIPGEKNLVFTQIIYAFILRWIFKNLKIFLHLSLNQSSLKSFWTKSWTAAVSHCCKGIPSTPWIFGQIPRQVITFTYLNSLWLFHLDSAIFCKLV